MMAKNDKPLDEMDQAEQEKVVEETLGKPEVTDNKPVLFGGRAVANQAPKKVLGMENLEVDDYEIPRIVLVQPGNYLKITLANGDNPKPGQFYFSDTQEAKDAIVVSLLLNKTVHFQNPDERTGEMKDSVAKRLLVVDVHTGKPYIMTLSVSNFGVLKRVNTVISSNATAYWELPVRFTSVKVEKDRNLWFVIDPTVSGEAISDQESDYCFELYNQFAKGQEDQPKQDFESAAGDVNPDEIPF